MHFFRFFAFALPGNFFLPFLIAASRVKVFAGGVVTGAGAGGGAGSSSKAPISQPGPCGLATPRWSTALAQDADATASTAGLPAGSAFVRVVAPGLRARGTSRGFVLS